MSISKVKNYPAILAVALCELTSHQTFLEYAKSHHYSVSECYRHATEIADPAELLKQLDSAAEKIAERAEKGIEILTIFDYPRLRDKAYIYYRGQGELLYGPKFSISLPQASSLAAMKINEIIAEIAKKLKTPAAQPSAQSAVQSSAQAADQPFAQEDENNSSENRDSLENPHAAKLSLVVDSNTAFATCDLYRKSGQPIIMTCNHYLSDLKNNFADCIVYDSAPDNLGTFVIDFRFVEKTDDNTYQTIAKVRNHQVNISELGPAESAAKIVEILLNTQRKTGGQK